MGYTVKSKQSLEGIQTLTGNIIALDNVRGSIGRILSSREEQEKTSSDKWKEGGFSSLFLFMGCKLLSHLWIFQLFLFEDLLAVVLLYGF